MFRNKIVSVVLTIFCISLLALAGPAIAQPLQVGQHRAISIASESLGRADGLRTPTGWRFEIHEEGATFIAVHFEQFNLPPGESVTISDAQGNQRYTLSGRGKMNAGRFWAQYVSGDTAVLEFTTRRASPRGFRIDSYSAGSIELGDPGQEAICGIDDKENAICYASSHPTEYARAQALARLVMYRSNGTYVCTGWLASAQNHFVTNEHCVTSADEALNTDFDFGYEDSACNTNDASIALRISGSTFIQDSAALDYALVHFPNDDPAATYGYLEIDNRDAVVGEEIYIPQHPGGRARELGIESSDFGDSGGICHVNTFAPGCSSSAYQDVGYQCDTEGGSSGSPVLARSSHKVIALHHCANCPNRGVPIDLVCAEICSIIQPACSTGADCDDGDACTADTCSAGTCTNTPIDNCCGNGTCEAGEDCDTCAADCTSGTSAGASCGNGICEAGDGEDCLTCPQDCNGRQNGKPANRFCCGAGGGTNPVSCSDSRCTSSGFSCTTVPATGGSYCCGDGVCSTGESCSSCGVDCNIGFEICNNGVDDDCNGFTDCDDSACSTDPSCQGGTCTLGQKGDPCDSNADCCSNSCKGKPGAMTCK